MALVINTNVSSLNAQRHLTSSQSSLNTSMERLASGQRINSAADDAAGLAIANRQTAQIRGLDQAVRNANDGISLIQTAEGALNESTNILQRMRELSIQASNGIYSDDDRTTLQDEVTELVAELDRIASDTAFNGEKILNGDKALTPAGADPATDPAVEGILLQVGSEANQTIGLSIASVATADLGTGMGTGTVSAAIADVDIATADGAQSAIAVIDDALDGINGIRAELGAKSNRLDFTVSNLMNISENSAAARSRIMDADFAAETAELSRSQVLQQASQAMLAQANAKPQQVLSLLQ